ncbi:MAG: AbrB/MazE/SpoVT family DNA-binding domain-containing protein [Methanosarcinales archaeon]|nr:MAG: AbrB/MazE/SpoVT family DNA-binding domain-containing protein [Methanosarcinales archaeon]
MLLFGDFIMRRKLQKNHKSIYCFVPKEIVEDLELKAGDVLDFTRMGNSIIAVPFAAKARI